MAESEGHGALTLWDLRSCTDDLPSPPASTALPVGMAMVGLGLGRGREEDYHDDIDNFQSQHAADGEAEFVVRPAKVECLDLDVDEQVSDETIETKPPLGIKKHCELDKHSATSETRFQEYFCESFDEVDSQIDEDGWFVDKGKEENEPELNKNQGDPVCTSPIDCNDSLGASKRLMALAFSVDARNVFKRKNINVESVQSGSVSNIEKWSNFQINEKTRLVLDEITASGSDKPGFGVVNVPSDLTSSSDKPGFSGMNAANDPRVSQNSSIGRVGSLSLPAPSQTSQELESIGPQGEGEQSNARTSNASMNLPDVVPNQSQQRLKSILDQAVNRVKRADEFALAQKAACRDPNRMAHNHQSGKKEEIKKKPRPSERARILQRRVLPKPMPLPNALTVVALIPVVNVPSQESKPKDTATVIPTQTTTESQSMVDEKSNTEESTEGKTHMVLRSHDKNRVRKRNQAELNKICSEGSDDDNQKHCTSQQGVQNKRQDPKSNSLATIPNPLYPAPVFRRIAPRPKDLPPARSPPKKLHRRRSKRPILPNTPQLVVPLFELVPDGPATSTSENLPKCKSNVERPFKPKPSSARRKQDPLSVQTKGEKWRQEESEILIQESDSDHEETQDQGFISLISEEEDDDVWEVVKMEVNSDEERNQLDQGNFSW